MPIKSAIKCCRKRRRPRRRRRRRRSKHVQLLSNACSISQRGRDEKGDSIVYEKRQLGAKGGRNTKDVKKCGRKTARGKDYCVQCDQIGRFLKALGYEFSNISSSNVE